MLRLLYEAVNHGLINEHHLDKQRKYIKELFKLRKKYCVELSRNMIEYADLLNILQTYEKEFYEENKDTLQSALTESKVVDEVKIKDIIIESLRLDLENPKLPQKNKLSLIQSIAESVQTFTEKSDKFNPFSELKISTCPITWLDKYTRAGKGDIIVFAAPEKTGKTTVTLANCIDDVLLKGKSILYLDYANGWNETVLRIASKVLNRNLGGLPIQELNTILKKFQTTDQYRKIFSKLIYVPHPTKKQTVNYIEERQYDYIVFDDLHKLIFDKNIAESTLKAYNWALELCQQNDQCALVLGHPNDNNTSMESFVLSGGQRLHKDLTTLIAMLPTENKVLHIKAIRERKLVAPLDMYIELQPPTGYKEVNYNFSNTQTNTSLEKLSSDEDDFTSLGLDSLY